MKKLLVLLLASLAVVSHAATHIVYQPVAIPMDKPCFVSLSPTFVLNASMVIRIEYGEFNDFGKEPVTIFWHPASRRAMKGDHVKTFLDGAKQCKGN